MKKRIGNIMIFMFMLFLVGCAKNSKWNEKSADQGEGKKFSSLYGMEWKDNSLDAYSAEFLKPLKYTEQEGAIYGGAEQYVLGKDRAMAFKKHLFEKVDDRWDELKVITESGEENSFRLNFEANNVKQVWAAGCFFDNNHCMMMDVEAGDNEDILYRFFEIDENMQVLRQFYVEGLDKREYEFPRQMLVDVDGNIHVTTYRNSDNAQHYYVISPDGARLTEFYKKRTMEQEIKLFYLYDGRTCLRVGKELLLADVETGKMESLVKIKQDCMACTLWDDNSLLYADDDGMHISDLSGNEAETIYCWENHGIICSQILEMRLSENREISLLYVTQESVKYAKFRPTTEEVQILTIEFAVSSSSAQKYRVAVAEFNNSYPALHVNMKTYGVNDASLLTKLTAGGGPQLIDSFLVGFEDCADLWEPLDEFYKQLDFKDELIPEVVETIKINNVPFGVSTGFYIDTMVTLAEVPDGWDYNSFLEYLLKNEQLQKAIYNPINGSDGVSFASIFFHDLSETFLYDAETKSTRFNDGVFQKIMRLAKNCEKKENRSSYEDVLQGEAACAIVEIRQPEDLAGLRLLGNDHFRYVGFPSQTGAVNYLVGSDPLCIRRNASEDEKKLAGFFLMFLLSDEMQTQENEVHAQWCIRKDLLKKQFDQVDESSVAYLIGFPQISLAGHLNRERDAETLYNLLSKAKAKKYAPKGLRNILMEEVSSYLEGGITEEELISHLTKRVELYLKEL